MASGYSVQQIRDLERQDVIPPAWRQANGYRRFGRSHLIALRAYRNLAVAVGPVVARATMRDIRSLDHDEAIARIVALHVTLARARDDTIAAVVALDSIVGERAHEADAEPDDSMNITELARALGVRSSALRFWEQQGLITPDRQGTAQARHYPPEAIGQARIVAALRAGGYPVPAVQAIMASLAGAESPVHAREALRCRLRTIASRSEALLRAGSDLADAIAPTDAD